ncbi:MAG TPA: NRDE family protein [Candidatus Dormibacteraeota bacterium]
MCTILLAWRCHPDAPIVLAANRDELIARPSSPPGLLNENPWVVGGRDLLAGGTWLAIAAGGMMCAVTNRHATTGEPLPPDPTRRSRGEIPLSLLLDPRPDEVRDRLAGLGPGRYNPVNVLWLSADHALVAHVDDAAPVRVVDLAPGAHVLTTGDLDDASRPKVAMLSAGMDAALGAGGGPDGTLARMRALLADHTTPTGKPVDAACIHGDIYGTVSASTVIAGPGRLTYEHAPGRPCVTPFTKVTTPS